MTATMELTCVLPYIGKNSLYLRTSPGQTIKRNLNSKKVIPIKDILIDDTQKRQHTLTAFNFLHHSFNFYCLVVNFFVKQSGIIPKTFSI